MTVVSKRSAMTFYSDSRDHYSHRVRIVLAEKGVAAELVVVDPKDIPRELSELNPYNSLPTLVDRDLVLYESKVIMEYLDERFPHPPLLPVYPVARAQSRLWMYRIERNWCPLIDNILHSRNKELVEKSRKELYESIVPIAPIFTEKPYFMSDEFTIVDCCLAPILWRLEALGVKYTTSKQTKPLDDYMQRLFSRPAFKKSLTDFEQEMRSAYTYGPSD
jgi:stringent starvation protein A